MNDREEVNREEARSAQQAIRNPDAFLRLYDRYFSRIYTYFRYRIQDLPTCDDLTSQTFEQALAHLDEYRPERGVFAAWLFGIARNLANGSLREKLRFQCVSLDNMDTLQKDELLPEDAAIRASERQTLLDGIRVLPDRQKDLLGLKFLGGFTNREIAALTGLSESNVGVLIHRAVTNLRKKIEAVEMFYE